METLLQLRTIHSGAGNLIETLFSLTVCKSSSSSSSSRVKSASCESSTLHQLERETSLTDRCFFLRKISSGLVASAHTSRNSCKEVDPRIYTVPGQVMNLLAAIKCAYCSTCALNTNQSGVLALKMPRASRRWMFI